MGGEGGPLGCVVQEPLAGRTAEAVKWRPRRRVLSCGQWEARKVSETGRAGMGVGVRETSLTAERTDWW